MNALDISLSDMKTRTEPGRLTEVRVAGDRAELRTPAAWAELTSIADGIVRVEWHPGENWQNAPTRYVSSGGPPPTVGPAFSPRRVACGDQPVCSAGSSRRAGLQPVRTRLDTGSLTIEYATNPLHLRFHGVQGPLLAESSKTPPAYGSTGVAITWEIARTDRIYGLGQNAFVELNRVGQVRRMAADHAACDGGDVPIAFFISTGGYGVVVDNPHLAEFDLRRPGRITFRSTGGYISYFVLAGPGLDDVLRRYVHLTGRPSLPPRWMFGPSFCRIPGGPVAGYRTANEVMQTARTLRRRGIPADALILDFQWEKHIGDLRWDRRHFLRARTMLRELDRQGLKTLVIMKPAVNVTACTAQEVVRRRLVFDRLDGSPHACNFHRGQSYFLDVFNPRTRRWYAEQLRRLLADGVAGWWTDEGDWLGYLSQSVRDLSRSPAAMRNLYGDAWCAAIDKAQRSVTRNRVVNITRSVRIGSQRHGTIVWSGDVSPTWECLAAQIQMGLNMGLSGVPFWTTDGGGFEGPLSRELYVRWAQFAAFSPITRFHGCGPREPWHFGPRAEAAVRHILEWRMRLLPYIYSTARQAYEAGLPMMRPMAWLDPRDRHFAGLASQYLFGDALLVRPVTQPLAHIRKSGGTVRTDLTAGPWYDFWTNDRVWPPAGHGRRAGKPAVSTPASLGRIPVFVRGPALVPLAHTAPCTRDQSWDALTLRVYTGDPRSAWQADFTLYEDDGTTTDYEKGQCFQTRLHASCEPGAAISLTIAPDRRHRPYVPKQRQWRIELIGLPAKPVIRINHEPLPVQKRGTAWLVRLPRAGTTRHLTLEAR
ncbi:MAG: glycoside hydrolase family 31 protein [Phycisphaerae bacterium]|nr:glycoside hydrolase family 31 protein [Phycisphaerae bacterium]